jgi:hypothetical protein
LAVNNTTRKLSATCVVKFQFVKKESWVTAAFMAATPSEKERLLQHEMGHYRLAILYTKRLNDALHHFVFDLSKVQYQYDSIFAAYNKQCAAINDLYEVETDHARNLTNQAKWDKTIVGDLIQVFRKPENILKYKMN